MHHLRVERLAVGLAIIGIFVAATPMRSTAQGIPSADCAVYCAALSLGAFAITKSPVIASQLFKGCLVGCSYGA